MASKYRKMSTSRLSSDPYENIYVSEETASASPAPLPQYSRKKIPEINSIDNFTVDQDPNLSFENDHQSYKTVIRWIKYILSLLLFVLVLLSAAISKGTILFMTSQIGNGKTTPYCPGNSLSANEKYQAVLTLEEQAQWIWALFLSFLVPELLVFLRSLRILVFKSRRYVIDDREDMESRKTRNFLIVFLFESLHTIGIAMLLFVVLPNIDVIKGAMLTNCFCLVPALLALTTRPTEKIDAKGTVSTVIDVLAVTAQVTGLLVWPILLFWRDANVSWSIPLSLLLVSFGWWENFVDPRSVVPFVRGLAKVAKDLSINNERYRIYLWMSLLKVLLFFAFMVLFVAATSDNTGKDRLPFFEYFMELRPRSIPIEKIDVNGVTNLVYSHLNGSFSPVPSSQVASSATGSGTVAVDAYAALNTWIIQFTSAMACYECGKYACRIWAQRFGFALPINLAVPIIISLLVAACGMKKSDVCNLSSVIPSYLYWSCPPAGSQFDLLTDDQAWIWILWFASQAWTTYYLWSPTCDRVANTDKVFVSPMYNGILVDQSLALNRRRVELNTKDEMENGLYSTEEELAAYRASQINQPTKIYACVTAWHETEKEMLTILKSVMRMDIDQSAQALARNIFKVDHPDFFTYETHFIFDDAFVNKIKDDSKKPLNEYAKTFIQVLNTAAGNAYGCPISLPAPTKIVTPYGARLVFNLPGGSNLVVHLKDKDKIRHRKRWSQVMYMFYLLKHLFEQRKGDWNEMERNTFILALDGDIDFKPEAIKLLVDLMKRDPKLGAACGRIYPIGTGLIAWYQRFEYAIGHWLQKAAEHVFGCVLCSPGCFSLFRAAALRHNESFIMKRYMKKSKEAKHYVQYDQGEDRWLCTMMLQQGFKIEYAAASEANTQCPEDFKEFFNQRRRWVPSTMINILDLLTSSKTTCKINPNISIFYIIYQGMLMFGTVLGPGTIFLMIVGSFVLVFSMSSTTSLIINLIPIIIFIIMCLYTKQSYQIMMALILSTIYALLMIAVIVSILIEIYYEGLLAPSTFFLLTMALTFVVTALLHPTESLTIIWGVIYWLLIPSMYLLLMIYSFANIHDVTWGTRENTTADTNESVANNAGEAGNNYEILMGKDKPEEAVAVDDSGCKFNFLGSSFSCCSKPEKKKPAQPSKFLNQGNTTPEDETVVVPWFNDDLLPGPTREIETREEIEFWSDLVEKNTGVQNLCPLDENPAEKNKIKEDLMNLRNQVMFSYLLLNAFYVVIVGLLQLHMDVLYVEWPFGATGSFTYTYTQFGQHYVHITVTHLHIEPVGLVLVIFFSFVTGIQFIGMLFHRVGTSMQVMASTHIAMPCSGGTDDAMSRATGSNGNDATTNDDTVAAEEVSNIEFGLGIDPHFGVKLARDLQILADVKMNKKQRKYDRRINKQLRGAETLEDAFMLRFNNAAILSDYCQDNITNPQLRRQTQAVLLIRRNTIHVMDQQLNFNSGRTLGRIAMPPLPQDSD